MGAALLGGFAFAFHVADASLNHIYFEEFI